VTRPGDAIFSNLSRGSGILLLVVMAAIAVFLTVRAVDAIAKDQGNFLTERVWNASASPPVFGIATLAYGTLVSSIIALLIAVPIAIGIALFITQYAPRRLALPISFVIDLLAAVPSIIYGLWGALFLVPHLIGLNKWLNDYFAWTVILKSDNPAAARSLFTVGVLLAIMILPIITNVSREVFNQVPKMHEEAALALGATRWETIRLSVLPFARSGIISASMLGLGRALGETMAVATVLSASDVLTVHILDPAGGTFSQNIVAKFGEANEFGRNALIASGLVLFIITLLVNGAARLIIARRKEYSGANA
jgi:phosphate transport system permease protein